MLWKIQPKYSLIDVLFFLVTFLIRNAFWCHRSKINWGWNGSWLEIRLGKKTNPLSFFCNSKIFMLWSLILPRRGELFDLNKHPQVIFFSFVEITAFNVQDLHDLYNIHLTNRSQDHFYSWLLLTLNTHTLMIKLYNQIPRRE